jgi:SAM-dependent methyltransferase
MASRRPSTVLTETVGNRIRHGLRRRAAAPEDVDLDPQWLPPRRALALPGETDDERFEDERLSDDLIELHEKFSLTNVDLVRSPQRALAPLVRSIRGTAFRLLWPILDRQSAFNGAVARSFTTLRDRSLRDETLVRTAVETLTNALTNELTPAVRGQAKALQELERRVRILEDKRDDGRAVKRIDNYEFANRFRGTEESVRERQRPHVELFADVSGPVLDLGCGRGEFLELLREAGIAGYGVDLDREMVEHCRSKGLSVDLRDGLTHLESLPADSLGGIFASQLLEHLDLPSVLSLLQLARRALKPGGVLLVETHNPQTFITYPLFAIDPTHVRLYHSETVFWLLEQEGFMGVETRFGDAPVEGFDLPDDTGDAAALMDRLRPILHGYLTYTVVGRVPTA